jgi:hypothetical protein
MLFRSLRRPHQQDLRQLQPIGSFYYYGIATSCSQQRACLPACFELGMSRV